ncbi:ATP-binding protein [Frankia sp. AgB32]|uniref:ATP-binding protein n=1 Tax=Frankia sp. AgB32 TaxID=631119 RepID=UPI00200C0C74|nr:ATP-binding protein [Frankia sp. AgB32]MCK9895028.1 ATP-binding protein [Frankia sp. AgB32]
MPDQTAGRDPGRRRRHERRGRSGARLALPWNTATTAHLGVVNPWSIEAGLGEHGVLLGANRLAGGPFTFDLVDAYEAGLIQGPNMVVSGAGAYGKSAIVKSYVHRAAAHAALTGRRRFTAVIDPKGEWTLLGERLGFATLRLRPGGGLRVNPLDTGPGIPHTSARTGLDDVAARRAAVLTALIAIALDQASLPISERRLLSAVACHLSTAQGPAPTLVDVRRLLAAPSQDLAADLDTTHAELLDRRRPLLDACATLLEQDLRGICDGPTTPGLWDHAPGLILDLSALLTHRRALRLVLTATASWLQAVMYGQNNQHTIMILDEAWIALDDLAIVRFLQDQWRLGRQWGAANILITHAVADLRSQTDTGSATAHIAEGLLNTTSVRVFLHQNPEQVGHLLTDLGLTATEAAILGDLPPFTALWHVGPHPALVDHLITDDDWTLADTDTAMRAGTRRSRPSEPDGS